MSYALIRIVDDTFEEPYMVLGASEEHVAGLAVAYLRAARPLIASTGKRLEVPDHMPEHGWANWLDEAMHDVEDITITSWNTDDGDLLLAGQFIEYVAQSADALAKQHAPLIEDVVFMDERTTL